MSCTNKISYLENCIHGLQVVPLELDVDWTIDLQGVVNRLIRTPLFNSGVDIFPVPEIRE